MTLVLILALILAAPVSAAAQAPAAAPAKPDSAEVRRLIEQAKKTAGAQWAEEAHFFCEAPRGNSPNDPAITPTKIFDNVYVIGNAGTVVYIVQTSNGLVMFDSMTAAQLEAQLLPGFQALGLDPANVRVIVVAHGHADHYGGARYFQERFGSRIYLSAADWTLMENPPAGRGGQPPPTPTGLPARDQVVADGQPIAFGDFTVTPVAIPGHTPGSMGFIFPVKDAGRTRMAAMFGGTILNAAPIPDEGLQTYLKSVARFKEATRKAGVEIVLQNHPLMDPILPKLARMQARRAGDPNPWVVGPADYQTFLDVMAQCTEVNVARRKG
jgi:metallo-beta-lactamase class B